MKKNHSLLAFYFILLLLAGLAMSGCGTDDENQAQNNELKTLLPNELGYVWIYEGFAEYFQIMEIESIETQGSGYKYRIRGSIADMSSGESDRDFRFTLEYVIQDGVLYQNKQEEVMMDSIFDTVEIVRYPLEKGQEWQQTQVDKDGVERTLTCTIDDVYTVVGRTTYLISYQDNGSEYYEKRELQSGIGVVRVETLWVTDDGSFPLQYNLYRSLGPAENT